MCTFKGIIVKWCGWMESLDFGYCLLLPSFMQQQQHQQQQGGGGEEEEQADKLWHFNYTHTHTYTHNERYKRVKHVRNLTTSSAMHDNDY